MPEAPMHLDALLADEPLVGGLEPRLGAAYLKTLTVIGFPNATFRGSSTSSTASPFPTAGRPGRSASTRPTRSAC